MRRHASVVSVGWPSGSGGRAARVAVPLRPAPQASLRTHQQLGIRHRCSPAGLAGAARALRILPSSVSPSLDSSPFRRTLLRNLTRSCDSLRCSSSSDRRRVPVFSVRPVLLLAADWACIAPSGDGTISVVGPLVGGQGSSPSRTSHPARSRHCNRRDCAYVRPSLSPSAIEVLTEGSNYWRRRIPSIRRNPRRDRTLPLSCLQVGRRIRRTGPEGSLQSARRRLQQSPRLSVWALAVARVRRQRECPRGLGVRSLTAPPWVARARGGLSRGATGPVPRPWPLSPDREYAWWRLVLRTNGTIALEIETEGDAL